MKKDFQLQYDWIGYRLAYVYGRDIDLAKRLLGKPLHTDPKHGCEADILWTSNRLYSE